LADVDTATIELSEPSPAEPFSHRWPGGDREAFPRAWEAHGTVEGKPVLVRYGLGSRRVFGRDRVHSVVFVNGQPVLEGAGTDDYEDTRFLAAILKLPNGRHAREPQEIPTEYQHVPVRQTADVIQGPPRLRALSIVLPEDDVAGWSRVALTRLALRGRAVAEEAYGPSAAKRWLFQANPKVFNLDEHLRSVHVGSEGRWTVSRYRAEIHPGHSVILWQAGPGAGVRALGEITSEPFLKEHPEYTRSAKEWDVRFRYTHILAEPLPKAVIQGQAELDHLDVVRFPQATNFRVTAQEWSALLRLLAERGVQVESTDLLTDPWDPFVTWASRLYELEDFATQETDYKLEIAQHIRDVQAALQGGADGWLDVLKRAFGSPNNLTPWQIHDAYIKWAQDNLDEAASGLRQAWDEKLPFAERIDAFLATVPVDAVSGPGRRVVLASFLQMGIDEHSFPIYRPDPVRAAYRLTRFEEEPKSGPPSEKYAHFLRFLDTFMEEAAERGLVISDRLDAQGLMWMIVKTDPPSSWTKDEQEAFLQFRSGGSPGSTTAPPQALDDLVERFKDETGYPTDEDQRRIQERSELADALTREALAEPNVTLLRRLGGPAFGSPGPQSSFMALLNTDEGPRQVADSLSYLLYGSGSLSDRMDEILSGPRQLHGMKEALLTKALAVAFPEDWVPVFVSRGDKGKLRMLARLETPVPDRGRSAGAIAVESNEHLRVALDGAFSGDTYGMKEFLYWLLLHEHEAASPETLTTLAKRLYLDSGYLQRIERLVRDRGQVIFYGPPGTGKTFVARELARFFSRTGGMRKVQFHPSYAYEDFVEGYRPRLIDGRPGFQLVAGPLKQIALEAQADEAGQYVLLIDEINRGNVAKIFGELYYVLEYRDEEVLLQYSAEPFSLPRNLWIIGTMNTADRSIALVDAALRRRFHFVPFFPGEAPIQGLLRRWLTDQHPTMTWVADVLDRANAVLDDPNVAIGPSHFLRKDLSDEWVELIWEHSVLPYLAEHFIGDEARLKELQLRALRAPKMTQASPGDGSSTADAS
jgi:MoxR-like ATPase